MDLFTSATKIEERIVLSATEKKIPLGGAFELLPLCNMDCRMCFLRLSPAEMKEQGRLRTADEWLALAEEARDAGLLFLLLTGGEPFLFPEFKKLYEGLCRLGLIITINSNGTLLTEEIADVLAAHKPRRVNITLYGSSDEIYSNLCKCPNGFTKAMQGIRLLKDRKIDVKLNGSLTKYNMDDLPNLQRIAKELDIPLEVDSYMFPSSRKGCMAFDHSSRLTPEEAAACYVKIKREELSPEEFQALCEHMSYVYNNYANLQKPPVAKPVEPLPCRAGLSSFWINWKGDMTPCVFMEQPGIPVFEKGFAKSWDYVKEERTKIFLPAECSTCGKRSCCTVCGAAVLTENGTYGKAPDYLCKLTSKKMQLINALYYIKEREC